MLRDADEFQRLLEAYPDMDPQVLKDARKGFLEGKLNAEFVRGGETSLPRSNSPGSPFLSQQHANGALLLA